MRSCYRLSLLRANYESYSETPQQTWVNIWPVSKLFAQESDFLQQTLMSAEISFALRWKFRRQTSSFAFAAFPEIWPEEEKSFQFLDRTCSCRKIRYFSRSFASHKFMTEFSLKCFRRGNLNFSIFSHEAHRKVFAKHGMMASGPFPSLTWKHLRPHFHLLSLVKINAN